MGEAILHIRDAIGEKTSVVNITGPGYNDGSLTRIFSRMEAIYYRKEISYDPSRFLTKGTLTGTGVELIAQPAGFGSSMMYGLYSDEERTMQYDEIPFVEKGGPGFGLGRFNVYYFLRDYIGVIPIPSSGDTLYFDWYAKYIPMSYTEDSDLHEYSVRAAILATAVEAMAFRGDGNLGAVEKQLLKYERDMLPKISRSSRGATSILPRGGQCGFNFRYTF